MKFHCPSPTAIRHRSSRIDRVQSSQEVGMNNLKLLLGASILLVSGQVNAALIDMYDPADIERQFLMSGETRYVAFQALQDVQLEGVTNSGNPVDPIINAAYTYQLFQTDENWVATNGNDDRLWISQGQVNDLGGTDQIDVTLEAGGYYRISFSTREWLQDIFTRGYDGGTDPLRVSPFTTTGDVFNVVGPGVRANGNDFMALTFEVSAISVPAPPVILLFLTGLIGLIGFNKRRNAV